MKHLNLVLFRLVRVPPCQTCCPAGTSQDEPSASAAAAAASWTHTWWRRARPAACWFLCTRLSGRKYQVSLKFWAQLYFYHSFVLSLSWFSASSWLHTVSFFFSKPLEDSNKHLITQILIDGIKLRWSWLLWIVTCLSYYFTHNTGLEMETVIWPDGCVSHMTQSVCGHTLNVWMNKSWLDGNRRQTYREAVRLS